MMSWVFIVLFFAAILLTFRVNDDILGHSSEMFRHFGDILSRPIVQLVIIFRYILREWQQYVIGHV